MRRFRWRTILVVTNLVLAIGMSAIGLQEYRRDHHSHPEYFYHGTLYYVPPMQMASYCLNMPAFVASTAFHISLRYLHITSEIFDAYLFFYVNYDFYLFVVLFWWVVTGRLLNRRPQMPRSPNWPIRIISHLLGALISLGIAYAGFFYRKGDIVAKPMPLSALIWGLALFTYFVVMLLRSRRTYHQATA